MLGSAAVATTTVPLAVIVLNVLTFLRFEPAMNEVADGPQSPDDEEHWRGGLLYVNRDDPAFWVPKRSGIGETINLGHPAGRVAGVISVVVIAAAIAVPLVLA